MLGCLTCAAPPSGTVSCPDSPSATGPSIRVGACAAHVAEARELVRLVMGEEGAFCPISPERDG